MKKFLFLLLVLSSLNCKSAVAQTIVSGTIATNTTWTVAGSPYRLSGDVTVNNGVTLTIQPGVSVEFTQYENLRINGSLSAIGTAADSISFVGETTRDGGVTLQTGSSAQLAYTRFLRMGDDCCDQLNALSIYTTGTVSIAGSRFYQCRIGIQVYNNATPSIANSTFQSSQYYGIQVDDGYATITGSAFKNNSKGAYLLDASSIQTSSFTNNGNGAEDAGIHIDAAVVPVINANTFSGNWIDIITHPEIVDDTYFDNNGLSRIYIDNKPVTANSTWHAPVSPELWDFGILGDITVNTGVTLTIQPGVSVRFSQYENIFVNGSLSAIGTAADSISFIGETTRDGGVSLQNGSTAQLAYTRFLRMGDDCCDQLNALSIYTTGTVSIAGSRFYQCRIGVQVYNNATPTIANSKFESSQYYGIQVDDGYATITGSAFKNNGDTGALLYDASSIQTSSFTGNGNGAEDAGIHINAAVVPVINANTFSGNWIDVLTHPEIVDDAYFDNNGLSRIYIDNKPVTTNSTWHRPVSPELWDYGMVGDVTVNTGVTLTIQPSVSVRFSQYENIFVNGSLTAIGTAADSISFIGETTRDGGVSLQNGSSAQLAYTRFLRMGDDCCDQLNALSIYTTGTVSIAGSRFYQCRIGVQVYNNATPTIANTKFESSQYYGIEVDDGYATITGSAFKNNGDTGVLLYDASSIQTSSFTGNGNGAEDAGIHINAAVVPVINANTFSANWIDVLTHPEIVDDAYFDNNGLSRIYIDNKSVTTNSTWHFPVSPELWDYGMVGDVTVNTGVTLTIQPGVSVRFSQYEDIFVNGSLSAIGTAADSISFIGETTRDGGVALLSGSSGQLAYTRFLRMGDDCCDQLNALSIYTTNTVSISGARFLQCRIGIQVYNNATPTIANSKFESSQYYGIQVDDGYATITGSVFKNNGKGLYLLDASSVQNSSFTNNGSNSEDAGIHIDAAVVPVINANTFSGNWIDVLTHPEIVDDAYFDNNGLSRIYIDNKAITTNSTWHFPVSPELWDYGMVGDVTVNTGVTLTIQPGVSVRFSQYEDIFVNGSLSAIGTATDSISFIGETTRDGGVALLSGSSGQLAYTRFLRMGDDCCDQLNALSIHTTNTVSISGARFLQCRIGIQVYNNATPTIANSKFESSQYYGIQVDDGYATITGSVFKNNGKGLYLLDASSVQNSSFTNNGSNSEDAGIHIDAAVVPVINANTFSGNYIDIITHPQIVDDTYFDNNGLSRVYIDNKAIAANSTWHSPVSPELWDYGMLGDVTVNTGVTLTIQPGVSVLFSQYENIFVNGSLSAIGTAADSISFIGETTRDGGVGLLSGSSGQLAYTRFLRMGDDCCDQLNALQISSSAVTVANSRFYQCRVGIQVSSGAAPGINDVRIKSSSSSGIYVENGSPVISGSRIETSITGMAVIAGSPSISNSCLTGNTTFGINNTGGGTVNAANNWWGHITGPTNATLNPGGLGDRISANVVFTPWATVSCNFVPPPTITISLHPANQQICQNGNASFSVVATGDTGLQYQWQEDQGSGFVNLSNTTVYTGTTTATLQLVNVPTAFTGYAYKCLVRGATAAEVSSNSAVLTTYTYPAAPSTTGNSSCGPASLVLGASGGTNGQYLWYTDATGGTPIPGEVNSNFTTAVITSTTIYYAAIINVICESNRTPVTATINSVPSAPSASGSSRCGPGTVTLTATGGLPTQYRWYTVSTGGTPISGEVNGSYITPSLSTTTTYYTSLHDGICESTIRTPVTATINNLPAAPGASGGASCVPTSFTLVATGGVNGEYRWYAASTGGTDLGEFSDTYYTPVLSTTTTYFVAINDGTCESSRTPSVATVSSLAAPTITTSNCTAGGATLTGPVGFAGYNWSNGATTTSIAVTLAGSYLLYVIDALGCNSPPSTPVAFTSAFCNQAPVLAATTITTTVQSAVTVDVLSLASDLDNNVDFNSLSIVAQPISGALASIDASFNLVIDYSNTPFAGTDELTLGVCDAVGACAQAVITVEVAGDITVYNAVSPNSDGKNDAFTIEFINSLPETKQNKVTIFNRWGTVVYETTDYNNTTNAFKGLSNSGEELPPGTYFYTIEFTSGEPKQNGFISLRR